MQKSKLPTAPQNNSRTSWLGALKAPATALDPQCWTRSRKQHLWFPLKGWNQTPRSH